jgi:hypothetical protein
VAPAASSLSPRDTLERGRALFDAGAFFEAHEAWEEGWRGASGAERQLLQGLVQVAAAFHRLSRGSRQGALALLGRSLSRLRAGAGAFADELDLPSLLTALETARRRLETEGAAGPAPRLRRLHPGLDPDCCR